MSELYQLFPTPVIRVPATNINYDPVQEEVQSAIEQIEKTGEKIQENIPQIFGGYKDELPSFVDYQIDATYTPEEAEQAKYDEVNKIYTTFDGKKYKYILGSDGKGTFTKAQ
jgi:uncharacterized protein YaaR (DUF327 family)